MPHGVHVFGVIDEMHIKPMWIRSVLGWSEQRYRRVRRGEALLTREEANKIIEAFKETYGIQAHELFDWDADILPPGRRRRTKGTVMKGTTAA